MEHSRLRLTSDTRQLAIRVIVNPDGQNAGPVARCSHVFSVNGCAERLLIEMPRMGPGVAEEPAFLQLDRVSFRSVISGVPAEVRMAAGLLIFDLDGTLFRSETVTVPAVQRSFREAGLTEPSQQEICWFFGKPHRDFQEWLRSIIPVALAPDILAAVDRRELELVAEAGELYPGVIDMLNGARRRFAHLAICTNGEKDYVDRVVSSMGLRQYFDRIRFRASAHDTKIAMVAELLATLAARPAFVIGDRGEDVEAAYANGIMAIGARYGYGTVGELAGADATIQSPHSLLEVLSFVTLPQKRREP